MQPYVFMRYVACAPLDCLAHGFLYSLQIPALNFTLFETSLWFFDKAVLLIRVDLQKLRKLG